METCIFCKIIKGEIPSYKVYEDENFYAFLDIKPINPGHTLLIPKVHREDLFAFDEKILESLGSAIQKIGQAVKESTGADGLNLGMNNGAAAGQLIFHAHLHLIPRFSGDGFKHWEGKTVPTSEEFADLQKKIGESLEK